MSYDNTASHDRGAVLLLSLIMLTLLALMVSSALRASAYSVSAAGWLRLAHSVDVAGSDALQSALAQTQFRGDRSVTLPTVQTTQDMRVSVTVAPLGRSNAVPHRNYDPQTHAQLSAHYFSLSASVTTTAGYRRQHEALIAIVVDEPDGTRAMIDVDPSLRQTLAPGAMLLLGIRTSKVDNESL